MDMSVIISGCKTVSAIDLPKPRGNSVTNYRTRKNNLRRKLKKAQLVGGLQKLNEIKRGEMDRNKYKQSWRYLRTKSECEKIETERERVRVESCERTKVAKKEEKDEEEYFRNLFETNPDMNETVKPDSFVPDDRDCGLMGWPGMEYSDED
ncbi:unnamed protein product, partial [Allacma fusca]